MIKKRWIAPLVLGAMLWTACDSKLCYCYENGYEQERYVNSDTRCSAYSSGNRGCVEANERMDANQIARDQKRLKAAE